jgi:NADH-quinone oxidoreductase subunit L
VPSLNEEEFKPWYRVLYHKYYIDELYDRIFVKPLYYLSDLFYRIIDLKIVDGAVNAVGKGVNRGSNLVRLAQEGSVGVYIFAMVVGIILIMAINLF